MPPAAGWSWALHMVLALGLALLLWFKADSIARLLVPQDAPESSAETMRVTSLATLAFALAGLTYLISGTEDLLSVGVKRYMGGVPISDRSDWESSVVALTVAAVRVAIGLWLLAGTSGARRLFRWARTAGACQLPESPDQ